MRENGNSLPSPREGTPRRRLLIVSFLKRLTLSPDYSCFELSRLFSSCSFSPSLSGVITLARYNDKTVGFLRSASAPIYFNLTCYYLPSIWEAAQPPSPPPSSPARETCEIGEHFMTPKARPESEIPRVIAAILINQRGELLCKRDLQCALFDFFCSLQGSEEDKEEEETGRIEVHCLHVQGIVSNVPLVDINSFYRAISSSEPRNTKRHRFPRSQHQQSSRL